MTSPFKPIAQRIENAHDEFVQNVQDTFGVSQADAEKVLDVFKSAKVVKLQPAIGRYQLTHGAYWEADVIKRAINS